MRGVQKKLKPNTSFNEKPILQREDFLQSNLFRIDLNFDKDYSSLNGIW